MPKKMNAVKVLVLNSGVSQKEIGLRTGWGEGKVSRIVTGRPPMPTDEEFTTFAEIIGVKVEALKAAYISRRDQ